jgi:hypothetical protein
MEAKSPVKSPLDDYVSVTEAADLLRCSRARIYELGRSERLELVRYFGRTLVSQKSVQAVLKEEIKPMIPGDIKR